MIYRNGKRGMTMVELLVAAGIMGIVSVMIVAVFSQGMRLSQRLQDRLALRHDCRAIFTTLDRDLANLLPFTAADRLWEISTKQNGQDNSELVLLREKDGQIIRVRYALLSPKSGKVIQTVIGSRSAANSTVSDVNIVGRRICALARIEESQNGNNSVKIISRQVEEKGLRFLYGMPEQEGSGQIVWHDQPSAALPVFIKVEVDLAVRSGEERLTMARNFIVPTAVSFKQ